MRLRPYRLTVVRTIAKVYGCPKCKEEKANIVTPKVADALVPHSYASESVLAHSMYQKFVNAVPLYRQKPRIRSVSAVFWSSFRLFSITSAM